MAGGATCGCCRIEAYDRFFASSMANGMQGYERSVASVKEDLFQSLAVQRDTLNRKVDVLELGIGAAPNVRFYDGQARSIVGLDPNPFMEPLARQACMAAGCTAPLELVSGLAESMPLPDSSFDAVICTLTLCSVQSPVEALREVRRVLRPGGQFLFLEHVRDFDPGLLRLQQALLDPLQQALADGCHLSRDTAATIQAESWSQLQVQSFRVDGASLISPHIRGVATI